MLNCIYVGLGGFIGAVSRYLMGFIPINGNGFPFTTLFINLLGAALIGAFSELSTLSPNINPGVVLFLTTGLCGGFTTFSTFSLETVKLFQHGRVLWGLLYIAFSVALCLGGILLGRFLAKSIFA